MWKTIFLLVLLTSPVELRKGGVSSSSSRGVSASRTLSSSNSARTNTNTNYRPQTSNVRPAAATSYQQPSNTYSNSMPRTNYVQPRTNYVQQPTYVNRNSYPSSNYRSSSSSNFLTSLAGGAAGAAGGILAYQAGKAIIQSRSRPVYVNGRDYYWDQNYGTQTSSDEQCSIPISEFEKQVNNLQQTPDANITSTFDTLQFQDGSKPKQIVWTCRRGVEKCCGFDCCDSAGQVVNNNNNNNNNNIGSGIGSGVGGYYNGPIL